MTNRIPDSASLSERRRQASRDLMRAEILAAAQHIIRNQGLDGLSLRALAKSVGVTAPALYEYFGSKDEILKALFVQGSAVMLERMEEAIEDSSGGMSTLLAVLNGYRRFAHDEPDYFRLLFGSVEATLDLSEAEHAGMHQIFQRFVGVIVGCIDAGEIQPLPPMTLSCSLWALVHGAALLETESFMARKERLAENDAPFDAAIKLTLLSFATPKGVEVLGPPDEVV